MAQRDDGNPGREIEGQIVITRYTDGNLEINEYPDSAELGYAMLMRTLETVLFNRFKLFIKAEASKIMLAKPGTKLPPMM